MESQSFEILKSSCKNTNWTHRHIGRFVWFFSSVSNKGYFHEKVSSTYMLGKICSRWDWNIFLIFPENRFDILCKITPQFTWNFICFLGKIRKLFRRPRWLGCAVRLKTRRSRVQPPPRSATFFRGDWSWNIFYGHSLPSADSRRAVVSFWRKNVHNTG